jgi:hypothetical protein
VKIKKNADCWQKEKRKAEAASCRNLMKFFSRYIKCFTSRLQKIPIQCARVGRKNRDGTVGKPWTEIYFFLALFIHTWHRYMWGGSPPMNSNWPSVLSKEK